MDVKTSYGAMSKALNASGRHMAFSMCEWGLENPWEWGNDVAQAWRMHGDHTGNWDSTAEVRAWAGYQRRRRPRSPARTITPFLLIFFPMRRSSRRRPPFRLPTPGGLTGGTTWYELIPKTQSCHETTSK